MGKKGEYLVLIQFLLVTVFVALPVYPSISGTELFKAIAIIRWTFLILFTGCALIFVTCGSYTIRYYLTPLPYPVRHNQLVTTGIYGVVRHPLYSGLFFAASGWTLFSMSLSHFLLTVCGAIFFSYKSSLEEQWLKERHPEYAAYALRVKKFIPMFY
jgi:protein-S-isoprenylcysteine O-methyltransferase Ste14